MKKILIFSLLVVTLTISFFVVNKEDNFHQIPDFKLTGQKLPKWCWAASLEMIINYVNNDSIKITQEEIYQKTYDEIADSTAFCKDNVSSSINDEASIEVIKDILTQNNLVYRKTDFGEGKEALWHKFKSNLLKNQPILLDNVGCDGCEKLWDGHIMVVTGFLKLDSLRLIFVQDPWKPRCVGCNYYINFDSFFKNINQKTLIGREILLDIAKNNKEEESLLSRILNWFKNIFKSKNSESINIPDLREIDFGNQENNDASIIITKIEVEPKEIRVLKKGEMPDSNLINRDELFLVQVIKNNIVDVAFTVVKSNEHKDFYVDGIYNKCLFITPFNKFNNHIIRKQNSGIQVSFEYNSGSYSVTLQRFNEIGNDPKNLTESDKFYIQ